MNELDSWERMIKGGNAEFEEFYQTYFDKLYYLGLKYTSEIQIVEDSIQNLFIDFIKYRKKLTEVKHVRGYIYKSFQRLLFKELKKSKRFVSEADFKDSVLGFYLLDDPIIFSKDVEKDYKVKRTIQIIRTLPIKQQEAIYLKFTLALSYVEMSEYLNIGIESVRVIISRAISNIRLEIKRDENGKQKKSALRL